MDLLKNHSLWIRKIIYLLGFISFLIEGYYSYQGISNQLVGGLLGISFLSIFWLLSVFAFFVYGINKVRPSLSGRASSSKHFEDLPLILIEKQRVSIVKFSVFLIHKSEKIFVGYADSEEDARKLAISQFSIYWNKVEMQAA